MKRILLADLLAAAALRRAGYAQACQNAGALRDGPSGPFLELSEADYERLAREYRPAGLGDRIERAVKPLARLLKLHCIDPATGELRPDSGCAHRREWLNLIAGGGGGVS